MLWTDQVMLNLSDKTVYTRDDLFQVFQGRKQDLSESTFRWILYNLLREQKVFRSGYDTYTKVKPQILPDYKPYYSDKARMLIDDLGAKYSELAFVVFESVLLSEFLNHQIAQNTIYLQMEKDLSAYVFEILQEESGKGVLYKPGRKELERYWTRDCIVVLDLVSQSPLSQEAPHEITIEKMLVDIIADKSIASTFSPAEIPFIFDNAIRNYRIDQRRINRYAGRRGKTSQINEYMGGGK